MIEKLKILLGALALLGLLAAPAAAQQPAAETPGEAKAFIRQLADKTFAVLDNIRLTEEEREEEFRRLLQEGFEIGYIGKLVLGHYRRTASEQQMAEFERLFPDYIIDIYARRLSEHGDENFTIGGTSPAGKRDIYVHSTITRPSGAPFRADWRVRRMDGELRIIDVKIDGVSLLLTQRDDFSSRIAKVGMDGLLEDLRRRTADGKAS